MTHLKVDGLKKTFQMHILGGKQIHAFSDVTFEVDRGKFMGIAGPSGAGKSSMLRCIYRNYDPTAGGIFFYPAGEDEPVNLAEADDVTILKIRDTRLGYVSQFFQTLPRVTSMDVAALPLMEKGWKEGDAKARAAELFKLFGIPEKLWDSYPSTFSGGEKQRLNLMKTLIDCPEMVLLDEPTASLDSYNRGIILEIFQEMKIQGITMLGIFHNMNELESLADNIYHMKRDEETVEQQKATFKLNNTSFSFKL